MRPVDSGGRWAERVGRRRAFLVGLALFTVASAACALAPSLWTLVAFRLVQAAGAAILTPASLGLVIAALPEARARSVSAWAATGAAAAALGPVLGGLLVAASWRWIFLINVPIGVILLWTAARTVPESRDPNPAPVDGAGAVLLAFGVGAVSLALVQAQNGVGPTPPRSPPRSSASSPSYGSPDARCATTAHCSIPAAARAPVRMVQRHRDRVQRVVRRGTAREHPVDAEPVGLLGPAHRSGRRARTDAGPAVRGDRTAAEPSDSVRDRGRARQALWGAGIVLVLAGVDATPNYAAGMLPGWIVVGGGVRAAGAADHPRDGRRAPAARSRRDRQRCGQHGSPTRKRPGIAILVALLASSGFTAAWWAVAALAAVGAVTALGMSPRAAERPTTLRRYGALAFVSFPRVLRTYRENRGHPSAISAQNAGGGRRGARGWAGRAEVNGRAAHVTTPASGTSVRQGAESEVTLTRIGGDMTPTGPHLSRH